MTPECPRLTEAFLNSPVVSKNGYPYFVNPISDGIPCVDKELLDEVTDAILSVSEMDCDVILAPEAMGIPLAVMMTSRTGIPFSVIRKRNYGLPGEICLDQTTGYSRSPMYINGVSAADRVMIVDDVISTGGTLSAIIRALRDAGAVVTEVTAVFSKCEDVAGMSEKLGVRINHILSVSSMGGKPHLL